MYVVAHIDFWRVKLGSYDTALLGQSAKTVVQTTAGLEREQMLQWKSDQAAAIYSKCTLSCLGF